VLERRPGKPDVARGRPGPKKNRLARLEEHSGRAMNAIVAQSCHTQNRTKVVATRARRNRGGPGGSRFYTRNMPVEPFRTRSDIH